ncbi:MAG: FAD-binding oxidoreductase [Alphaproteobacteria bacterium]|nr:FAD-binding oxidoreductase [Alphaproteobacteria bacterium]
MRVLICGGGVVGASIAYFLSCRGIKATIIERTGLACAASGKAGGFLALDWCDGTALEGLARRSFLLHARLARELGGDWDYRRLTTYGGSAGLGRRAGAWRTHWVSPHVSLDRRLGSIETTAQVHPAKFTMAMMQAAQARGAELRFGQVTGILLRGGGAVARGVKVDGETIEGDAVVIAMGPWSILAAEWLPLPDVYGLKGHSLVFETGIQTAQALFLECREPGGVEAPELFARPDGTTYVCGISDHSPLPFDPGEVSPDPDAIRRLKKMCAALSPVLATAKLVARQACYRPITRDGLPLIGQVPGVMRAYTATGHSVWGILNAPATGEAMAELISDGAAQTVDLSAFDPGRFPPSGRRTNRRD